MNPALLDKYITIQTRSVSRDEYGGADQSWTSSCVNLPARLMKQSGDENRFRENIPNQVVGTRLMTFRVRFEEVGGMLDTAQFRVLYETEIYEIVHSQEIGHREWLDIIVRYRSTDNE